MTGCSPLHTETRPSVLSSQRIALVQHSGALLAPACLRGLPATQRA